MIDFEKFKKDHDDLFQNMTKEQEIKTQNACEAFSSLMDVFWNGMNQDKDKELPPKL